MCHSVLFPVCQAGFRANRPQVPSAAPNHPLPRGLRPPPPTLHRGRATRHHLQRGATPGAGHARPSNAGDSTRHPKQAGPRHHRKTHLYAQGPRPGVDAAKAIGPGSHPPGYQPAAIRTGPPLIRPPVPDAFDAVAWEYADEYHNPNIRRDFPPGSPLILKARKKMKALKGYVACRSLFIKRPYYVALY